MLTGAGSPVARPLESVLINGKALGNRYAIQPMEGWDGTTSGGVSEDVLRRWQRFGQSGAKLIYGCEAWTARPDGRANPNQPTTHQAHQTARPKLPQTLPTPPKPLHAHPHHFFCACPLTHS